MQKSLCYLTKYADRPDTCQKAIIFRGYWRDPPLATLSCYTILLISRKLSAYLTVFKGDLILARGICLIKMEMVPRGHDSSDVRLCQGKLKMHIKSNDFMAFETETHMVGYNHAIIVQCVYWMLNYLKG